MAPSFEIILPLRNPTAVLDATLRSLLEQSHNNFSVLISDNFSTQGLELVQNAVSQLESARIPVRLVRPPEELGRVEHWNWSHRQSVADWIKPLFVGDWLAPNYVERTTAAIQQGPPVDIINCSLVSHLADGGRRETVYPGGHRTPAQVLQVAYQRGNDFGGPVNICLRRLAFDVVGGYPLPLPVAADFWLILQLALRKGLVTCPELMAHFHYHPDRFSTNFPWKKINGPREFIIILLAATSLGCLSGLDVPVGPRNRLFLRVFKAELKRRLFGRK